MDDAALIRGGAVVLVNVFTPKPGRVDGALGNRLLKSLDGTKAVNVACLESRAKYGAWVGSDLFKNYLPRIGPFLDKVEPSLYEVAYGGG